MIWPRCTRQMLVRDELAGFEVKERFYEIGSVAGLEETETPGLWNLKAVAPPGEIDVTRGAILVRGQAGD